MTSDDEREASKRRRSDASLDNASPQSGDEHGFGAPTAASFPEQQPPGFVWDDRAPEAPQPPRAEADVGPPPAPETTASAPEVRVARDHIQHLGGWSEEEIAGWSDEGVLLADTILVGSARKLLRAFEDNPKMALWVILRARLESELRERLSESLAWALLVAELQPQSRAAEVRLELLAAGAWLVESELKPRALVALLDEAQAHGDYGFSVVRDVLPSFSWPELDRFLDQAGGRSRAAWEVFIEGTERVAPGILTGRRGGNAESLFSRFAQLLTDVRVEEWVKERLVRILRSCASPSTDGADLPWIVMELGRGTSAVVAEELARRAYVAVLREVDTNVRSWAAATEWLIEHPSAVRGDPSAGRLYLTIVRLHQILKLSGLRPERVSDYRVRALRCLAELAPIALPEQVEEIIKQLYERFSNQAKEPDPAVRTAASAALRRIQQRIREAPPEIGAPEWTSWPTPPGEAIIRFATSPRFPPPISLPIQDSLTVSPGSGPIPPVSRMDASQRSSGPTAAPSPDLDLSSFQFTANAGEDGFSAARSDATTTGVHTDQLDLSGLSFSFPTTHPAVLRARTLLVIEPEEEPSPLDVFEHGRKVLERIKQRRQPSIHDAQQYFDRLRATDFKSFSIPQKEELTDTASHIVEQLGWVTVLLCDPKVGEARITKMRCYVPNERSKGSLQARLGSMTVYTGRSWPALNVRDRDQKSLDGGRGVDDEKSG